MYIWYNFWYMMKIKDIILKNNILVAPMAGVTDRAFRETIYSISDIGVIFNEMVSAKAICYNDSKTLKMLLPFDGEDKYIRGIQLFGSDPMDFKKAIIKIRESNLKIDIIDINMGCPAPKIVKSGSGCFLLKDLSKIREIAESARSVWDKVLSFKIRIGISEDNINALEVAKILEESGADFITVHGRTYEGMFSSPINYSVIKKVKDELSIPVIFNGGIFTLEDANTAISKTGCDGIMLARGIMNNPFLGREIISQKYASKDELISLIKKHYLLNIKYAGEEIGTKEFRKNFIWYSKLFKGANNIRSKINELVDEKSFNTLLNELKDLELKRE